MFNEEAATPRRGKAVRPPDCLASRSRREQGVGSRERSPAGSPPSSRDERSPLGSRERSPAEPFPFPPASPEPNGGSWSWAENDYADNDDRSRSVQGKLRMHRPITPPPPTVLALDGVWGVGVGGNRRGDFSRSRSRGPPRWRL